MNLCTLHRSYGRGSPREIEFGFAVYNVSAVGMFLRQRLSSNQIYLITKF